MAPMGRHIFIGGRDRGVKWLRCLAERSQLPLAVYCLREDDHEAETFSAETLLALPKTSAQGKKKATSTSKMTNSSATT